MTTIAEVCKRIEALPGVSRVWVDLEWHSSQFQRAIVVEQSLSQHGDLPEAFLGEITQEAEPLRRQSPAAIRTVRIVPALS